MKIWAYKPPGTLWATLGLLGDCFTFYLPISSTYLLARSGVSASVGEISTHVSDVIWVHMYCHWILFLPVGIKQLLTFCCYYSQTRGFLYCAVYYVRSIKFAQGIDLHSYSHIFRSDTTHQKRNWFKMCYCGSKDKEASDSLIRVFKPHIY